MLKGTYELTCVNCDHHDEIMINIDLESGKVLQIYCYRDHELLIETDSNERAPRTYPMKNNLFVRLHKGDFKLACQYNTVYCAIEEDDESFDLELNERIAEIMLDKLDYIEIV